MPKVSWYTGQKSDSSPTTGEAFVYPQKVDMEGVLNRKSNLGRVLTLLALSLLLIIRWDLFLAVMTLVTLRFAHKQTRKHPGENKLI